MSWTDDEIDERMVRYFDHEMSLPERTEFEGYLRQHPELASRLKEWETAHRQMRDLRPKRRLPDDFSTRVLDAARVYATQSLDAGQAPWIPRLESAERPVIELPRHNDLGDEPLKSPFPDRRRWLERWWPGVAVMAALAASMLFWLQGPRLDEPPGAPGGHALISPSIANHSQPESKASDPQPSSNNELVTLPERDRPEQPSVELPKVESPAATGLPDALASSKQQASSPLEFKESASNVPPAVPSPDALATNQPVAPSLLRGNDEAVMKSLAAADLQPTQEQIKMLEASALSSNGLFVLVADVTLRSDAQGLDSLRQVLAYYDIPWAGSLEIDEATESHLIESRMIDDAKRKGLIETDRRDKSDSARKVDQPVDRTSQAVSLIFVKARGSRLDTALVDIMQRTEEFPEFSLDLAFDPPIQSLMQELRSIQEVSLPADPASPDRGLATGLRRPQETESKEWVSSFAAAPRRSPAMSTELRRQSSLPVAAEMMNPVSYSLIVVRHAPLSAESR